LVAAGLTDGSKDILLVTRKGQSIRFPEDDVRPMGRTATGVKGIELSDPDMVVGLEILDPHDEADLLTVTEHGYGKRTKLTEYRTQSRGGKGIIAMRLNKKTGTLAGCARVVEEDEIMLVSSAGKIIRLRVGDIPVQGRATQGVRLFMLVPGEKIVSLAKLAERE
jgi:DNA gyrase subunit A